MLYSPAYHSTTGEKPAVPEGLVQVLEVKLFHLRRHLRPAVYVVPLGQASGQVDQTVHLVPAFQGFVRPVKSVRREKLPFQPRQDYGFFLFEIIDTLKSQQTNKLSTANCLELK
jgi:hypothetical protein